MPQSSVVVRDSIGASSKKSGDLAYQEGWYDGRFDTYPGPSTPQEGSESLAYSRGYRDGLRVREMLHAELITPEKTPR